MIIWLDCKNTHRVSTQYTDFGGKPDFAALYLYFLFISKRYGSVASVKL